MAVVGIDFGTLHSKIGVARHRGIDIITNEVSNRATPSLVAFGIKQRAIGEAAKTQEISNFKNTLGSLKRLVGRTLNDPDVKDVEKKFINATLVDIQGTVGTEVNFRGERIQFTATQMVAMYLGKLRDIAAKELKTGVSDLVIAIPGWFTDIQRRAIIDAASIAGLNVLRLINETTAAALGYGITKSDLPDTEADPNLKPRHVVFVDVGHSSMSASVVAFVKGHLSIKAAAYDRHLGGRDIDYALVNHFAAEFKSKYKIDVLSNPKATFRLLAGCEKLKKVLSANTEAPINVESLMNDVDASSKLTRDEYESLISSLLERIPPVLESVLAQCQLSLDDIDAIELIGGSTRIPAIRNKISSVFPGKPLSTTLNQDEAVARGATFSCAMLSPIFRVRDFHVQDIAPYAIKMEWETNPSDPDDKELEVFHRGNSVPSTKVLSFYRKEPFDITTLYSDPSSLPGTINPWLGKVTVKQVPPTQGSEATCIKLKTRLNANGIVGVESAYVEEEVLVETQASAEAPAEGSGDMAVDTEPSKRKRKIVKKEISYLAGTSSLDKSVVEALKEQENAMAANDKLVADTEDRKNALEEYVYDTRGKLSDRYAPYVQEQEKSPLLDALQEAEDWLYSEEGEDATKSAYVERLAKLKVLGDPITFRWRESEERSRSVAALRATLDEYSNSITSPSPADKYSHIPEKEIQSIEEKIANTRKWLDDLIVKQSERPKNVDPVLKTEEIAKIRDDVIYFVTPILSKPKPKPPVIPGSGTQTPKDSGKQTPQPPPSRDEEMGEQPAPNGPTEMDVD